MLDVESFELTTGNIINLLRELQNSNQLLFSLVKKMKANIDVSSVTNFVFDALQIMHCIMQERVPLSKSSSESVIHAFIVASNLDSAGSCDFKSLSQIPSLCAKIQFLFKATIVCKVMQLDVHEEGTAIDTYLNLLDVDVNYQTPCGILSSLFKLARVFDDSNKITVSFGLDQSTGRVDSNIIFVNEQRVLMYEFKESTKRSIQNLNLLLNEILLGFDQIPNDVFAATFDDFNNKVRCVLYLHSYLICMY